MPSTTQNPDEEDDQNVSALNDYWLIIKFIMVCSGDILELFEVRKCTKEENVIYINDKNGVEDVGTRSRKDNDKWAFLLDYSSKFYFKCFSNCLTTSQDLERVPYRWEIYRIRYFAVKVTTNTWDDKFWDACIYGDYSFRAHKFEEFPWNWLFMNCLTWLKLKYRPNFKRNYMSEYWYRGVWVLGRVSEYWAWE